MRLMLTSLRCEKGVVAANLGRQLGLLDDGAEAGCDLVLFPEMSLTGSGPAGAIGLDDAAVTSLIESTGDGPAVCFGLVEKGSEGLRPTITQVVAAGGRIVQVHRKRGIAPDESAGYRVGEGSATFRLAGVELSLAICWEIGLEASYATESDIVLAPAAPGLYGPRRQTAEDWRRGYDWWRGSVLSDAARHLRPGAVLAVSTQAGATVDEDFPGWCALVGPGGGVLAELPTGDEGSVVVETGT